MSDIVERLASAIHDARFKDGESYPPGFVTTIAEEDKSGREYCFRLARAANAVVSAEITRLRAERDEARARVEELEGALRDIVFLDGKRLTGRQKYEDAHTLSTRALLNAGEPPGPAPRSPAGIPPETPSSRRGGPAPEDHVRDATKMVAAPQVTDEMVERAAEAAWNVIGPVYTGWPDIGKRVYLGYWDQYPRHKEQCFAVARAILRAEPRTAMRINNAN